MRSSSHPLALGASAVGLALTVACSGDATTGPSQFTDPASVIPMTSTSSAARSLLIGANLWVNPSSNARITGDAWYNTRQADANMLFKLAAAPQAQWIGNWNSNVQADVAAATSVAVAAGGMPVFVAYNIPQRDCGGLSGGGSTVASAYQTWITQFAKGIGTRRATVILEPDALAGIDCLSPTDQQTRFNLLAYAVRAFEASGTVAVYLDAGHPGWQTAQTMASRLSKAGITMAQGFSLNVSNFIFTRDNVSYGTQIAGLTGGKHFIVDTGRNGLGPTADYQWCNPAGRAIGDWPNTSPGVAYVDAFLWIKTPGESDGACNGAPAAGTWMPEYALGLAQRASY